MDMTSYHIGEENEEIRSPDPILWYPFVKFLAGMCSVWHGDATLGGF